MNDIAIVLVLYILFLPGLWMPLFNASLFFPDKRKYALESEIQKVEEQHKAQFEDVHFSTADGQTLSGWLFILPSAKKIVMVSHGNAGNIAHRLSLANMLLNCGVSVFLYDYQGYGESTGRPSISNVCNDAIAAFDYLTKQKNLHPDQIILYGESLGTGVTCELARKRNVAGLILQSGFFSITSTGRDFYPWLRLYPESFFPEPRMNNAAFLTQPHPPVLLIHGMEDKVLPHRYSESLMQKALPPKQLLLLPNTGHNDVVSQTELVPTVRTFLQNLP